MVRVLSRIPGVGALNRKREEFMVVGASIGAQRVNSAYERARKNFVVLAMGIESGSTIPKVLRFCQKFVRENRGSFPKGSVQSFVDLFERVNGSPNKADAKWLRGLGLDALKAAKDNDMAFWLGVPKRIDGG